ncbi:uncharacterized protein BDV14DRAFT_202714 [Aspergillus stella-maris]|uniref:uncharacterized protein n=1 Tax=Aspergillus stella-maris TaxID=1810926 RepID=UPI003CCE19B0
MSPTYNNTTTNLNRNHNLNLNLEDQDQLQGPESTSADLDYTPSLIPNVPLFLPQNTSSFFPTIPHYPHHLNASNPYPLSTEEAPYVSYPVYPEAIARAIADLQATGMPPVQNKTQGQGQAKNFTASAPTSAPARAPNTTTKTCIKCAKSYPENQFLNKRTGKAVRMCDPCRNASRVSHKKKRMREAAAKAAKEESDKRARAESSLSQEAFPSSPAPFVQSSPAQPVEPDPYFPSPTSDTSPGRMLMENLSHVVTQNKSYPEPEPLAHQGNMYPQPQPITSFDEFKSRVREEETPTPVSMQIFEGGSFSNTVQVRHRFPSTAPASPFLHPDYIHENLLARFGALPKKKSEVAHGQEVGVSIAVPRFDMHRGPLGQIGRNAENKGSTPAAENRLAPGPNTLGEEQQRADFHFDQAFADGDVVHVDMSIVCRFSKYRTRN